MKKYVLFFLTFFMIPFLVDARTYNYNNDLSNFGSLGCYDDETYILNPGDVIDFSDYYFFGYEGHIFINGERVDENCYGQIDSCLNTYTVDRRMIFLNSSYYAWDDGRQQFHFYEIPESTNILYYEDLEDEHLYRSGDIIIYNCTTMDIYYYNENGDLMNQYWGKHVDVIPQYNDKDVYWKVDLFDDGDYGFECPHFQPAEYIKPTFQLTCEDKSIEYGKKTRCTISTNYVHPLERVSFDLGIPNFKISDITYPDNIRTFDGDKTYNLRISNPPAQNMDLMYFYLEGTKNENYTDDIDILQIDYIDDVVSGSYDNVKGDLNIIPNRPIMNPKTLSNLLILLLPIIILGGIFGHQLILKRKQKEM